MSKFGGGGHKCVICDKTSYPAETIMMEKQPYHADCFRCIDCNKKMEGAAKAAMYETKLYCLQCFGKNGYAQKQRKVQWSKKEGGGGSGIASKFGGGGTKCTVCEKTVYAAETVSFEKKPYHAQCLCCSECTKLLTPSTCNQYDDKLFCGQCWTKGGYNRKQATNTKKTGTSNALASRFGGGGTKCTVCEKTVYAAEQVTFEKKPYHAECFKCEENSTGTPCGKKMSPSDANQYEGKIICRKCWTANGYNRKQTKSKGTGGSSNALASRFGGGGVKCVVCDKTVYPAELVPYEKNNFHSQCFACKNCSKQLNPSGCEGKKKEDGGVDVYCKKCWGELGLNRAAVN